MDEFAAVNPNPGLPAVAAAEPRRVRPRHQGPARARRRRHGVPAGRHDLATASTTSPTAQRLSPTLLEGYLRAASQISRLAVGDRTATAERRRRSRPSRTASQHRHVDGTPLGTRGGLAVTHVFPADGDYTFRMMLHAGPTGQLYGGPYAGEQVEVSIDGARVALLDINPRMDEADPHGMNLFTTPVHVTAGPHRVAAAFVNRFDGPVDDLVMPIEQHAGRHQHRRGVRRDRAGAPARPGDHRAARRDRRVRHGEPAQGVLVPADDHRRGGRLRPRHRGAAGAPGLPRPGQRRRDWTGC